jgi:MarR family transcriptional regulator for hemolysin
MDKLTAQSLLSFKLTYVARKYRHARDRALSAMGLSDALALPVVILSRNPQGMRQNALADALGVEGPSLVRLIDRLVQDGFVHRHEDPTDRRAKILTLTEAGQALGSQASSILNKYRAGLLENVTQEDLEATLRVLAALETKLLNDRAENPA